MSEARTYEIAGRLLTEQEVIDLMNRLGPATMTLLCRRYPWVIDLYMKAMIDKQRSTEITPA